MYVFHSTVHVRSGHEEEWERSYQAGAHPILKAPGFVRRMKLKDRENAGRYFYISIWDSFEDLEAYRATEAVRAHVKELSAKDIATVDRVECELVGGILE